MSGSCRTSRRSPRAKPFPPQPPPKIAPLCSAGSSVLWPSQTPLQRTRPPYGSAPSRTALDCIERLQRSPGSRACCFSTCSGSSTTQGREPTRESNADTRAAFPFREQGRHPETDFSKLNSPARRYLCLRFTRRLAASSARLVAKVVRYSFLVGLFHSQQHAGLSRRSRDIRVLYRRRLEQKSVEKRQSESLALQRYEGRRPVWQGNCSYGVCIPTRSARCSIVAPRSWTRGTVATPSLINRISSCPAKILPREASVASRLRCVPGMFDSLEVQVLCTA